jgi:hypothetical protein
MWQGEFKGGQKRLVNTIIIRDGVRPETLNVFNTGNVPLDIRGLTVKIVGTVKK